MTGELGTVELPPDQLRDARSSVWAAIETGNSESDVAAYKSLVATISHPAAVIRLRAVHGTRLMQLLLNSLILWRRSCVGLCLALIGLGLWHRLFFLGIPVVLLVNVTAVNSLQTWVNVELFARLTVLDRLMDKDDVARKRVLGE